MNKRYADVILVSTPIRARLAGLAMLRDKPDWLVLDEAIGLLLNSLSHEEQEFVAAAESRVLARMRGLEGQAKTGRLADEIRLFVDVNYVQPAQVRGRRTIKISVKEVHRQMGLTQRYAAITSALRGPAFLKAHNLELVGPRNGRAIIYKVCGAAQGVGAARRGGEGGK